MRPYVIPKNVSHFKIKMFKFSKRAYLFIFLFCFIVWDLSRIFKTISVIVIIKERYSKIRQFHLGNCWFCETKTFQLPNKFIEPYAGDQIKYKFKSPSILKQKKNFAVFFVKSAVENIEQRNAIRKTWGSITKIDGHKIATVFVVGKNNSGSMVLERTKFKDILQINITDSFENLKYKTLGTFRWISGHLFQKSTFFIFTDDDCVINMHNTVSFLLEKSTQFSRENMYCGFQYESGSGVIRGSGKHSVQMNEYPASIFPDFCRGPMVILSYKMINDIYAQSLVTKLNDFPLEDVLVYGILRHKISSDDHNISPVINGGLQLVFYPWHSNRTTLVDKMLLKWKDFKTELYLFHDIVQKLPENVKYKNLLERKLSLKNRLLFESNNNI